MFACCKTSKTNSDAKTEVLVAVPVQDYHQILSRCQESGSKFEDPMFPPIPASLCQHQIVYQEQFGDYSWMRIPEVPHIADRAKEGRIQVFDAKIEPSDILQGALGDCYFLSTLSVLAEWPERIRSLFVNDAVNDVGIYGAWVTKNGERFAVVVDDFIPVAGDRPAFSQAHGAELWVIILEKVWAKIHGSYERIEAGQAHLTMRDLTGAPSYEYIIEETPGVFDLILDADQRHYAITGGCDPQSEEERESLEKMGLVPEHCYGIIKAARVKDKKKKLVELVQLRNPWGNFEWTGRWGDKSDCWTKKLKKELNYEFKDDGLFWMEFQDMKKFFPRVQISKIDDRHKYSFEKLKGSYGLVAFKVDEAGQHTFTLAQLGERMVPRDVEYQYSDGRLFLLRLEDGQDPTNDQAIQYIAGTKGFYRRDIHLECNLQPGAYALCAEVDWNRTSKPAKSQFVVTCYGASKVYFTDVTKKFQRDDVVRATLLNIMSQGQQVEASAPEEAPDCQILDVSTDFGYSAYVVNNGEANITYEEDAEFPEFEGVELLAPETGNTFQLRAEPGELKMVMMRMACNGFKLAKSYSNKFLKNDKALYADCLAQGEAEFRADGIAQYLLQHAGGVFIVYKNDTADKTLNEEVNFELEGLAIEGLPEGETTVTMEVGPGSEKIVKLVAVSDEFGFGMGNSYNVLDADLH